MSTKTTFKRIALVAVAALGAGVLSVAPANAAAANFASTPSVASSSATVLVGSTNAVIASAASATALDGAEADTLKVTAAITVPTGSTVSLTDNDGAVSNGTTSVFANTGKAAVFATSAISSGVVTATTVADGSATLAVNTAAAIGTFTIIPDAPGTYVLTLTGRDAADAAATTSVTYTLTVRSLSYTTGDTTAATPFSTGTGVAGVANTVTVTAQTTRVASQKALVTVSGAGATIQSASNSTVSADFLSTVVTAANASTIVIKTPTAGTVTVSLFNETAAGSGLYSTSAANTVTITVNAAAINGAYASSTAYMNTSTTTPTSTSDATTAATAPQAPATASNTPVANILVSQKDGQATPVNVATADTKAVVYEISGAGALGTANNARLGSYIAVAAASANDNIVYIYPDGRSGVGTVTVKVNGVLVSTKVVRFYGSVASYTLTVKNKVLSVGSTADTEVLEVVALDANGVAVPSATVNVSSSSTATATVDSATVTTGADGSAADIGVNGVAKGDAVITVGNAATSPTVSATATISVVAAGIASVALSFDKSEYNPGEKATISVTAKNADGALVGDEAYATLFALGGITSSSSLTTDLSAVSVTTVNGVKTYSVFMPLSAGPVTISATLGASVATAIQATVVTAATSVLSDGVAQAAVDAAAEAIDAANAATDAANAAAEAADAATAAAQDAADAVAALSTQVSEMINALKKQITALTNLVIKIQKKVKA
jgi:hypothetical protein